MQFRLCGFCVNLVNLFSLKQLIFSEPIERLFRYLDVVLLEKLHQKYKKFNLVRIKHLMKDFHKCILSVLVVLFHFVDLNFCYFVQCFYYECCDQHRMIHYYNCRCIWLNMQNDPLHRVHAIFSKLLFTEFLNGSNQNYISTQW